MKNSEQLREIARLLDDNGPPLIHNETFRIISPDKPVEACAIGDIALKTGFFLTEHSGWSDAKDWVIEKYPVLSTTTNYLGDIDTEVYRAILVFNDVEKLNREEIAVHINSMAKTFEDKGE